MLSCHDGDNLQKQSKSICPFNLNSCLIVTFLNKIIVFDTTVLFVRVIKRFITAGVSHIFAFRIVNIIKYTEL